jgi:hypothetical protein
MQKLLAVALFIAFGTQACAAADKTPKKTHDFLAYCKTNLQGCEDAIYRAYIAVLLSKPSDACPTQAQIKDRKNFRLTVVRWIEAHERTVGTDAAGARYAALKSIYPCRN